MVILNFFNIKTSMCKSIDALKWKNSAEKMSYLYTSKSGIYILFKNKRNIYFNRQNTS